MKARTRTIPLGASGTGATVLVAAPSDSLRHIEVLSYLVVMDGGGTFQFRSGVNNISDAIPAEDKGGVAFKGDEESPALICRAGEALSVNAVTGTPRGHLTYTVKTP